MKWVLRIACYLSLLPLMGQSWVNDYLKGVYNDPSIKAFDKQASLLDEYNFRTPLIREIDLRLRSNVLDPAVEEYRLRLDLTNPWLPRADKNYHQAYKNYQSVRSEIAINEVLQARYLDLIQHFLLTQSLALLRDHQVRIQQLISASNPSLKEALAFDRQILKLQLEQTEVHEWLTRLTTKMGIPDSLEWAGAIIESKEMMNALVENLLVAPTSAGAIVQEESLLVKDFEVQKSKARNQLGFIQPEYEKNTDKSIRQNLTFQFGVNIPIVNQDRAKLSYERLELVKEQAKLNQESKELELMMAFLKTSAASTFSVVQQLDLKLSELEKMKSTLPGDDWKVALEYLEYVHYIKKERLKNQVELMDSYIESLTISGRLAAPPLTNYLNAHKPVLN